MGSVPKYQLHCLEWSSAVVNCINDGNTLYDAVFEGQSSIRGLWVPTVMQMRLLSLEPSDWLWIIRDHRKSEVGSRRRSSEVIVEVRQLSEHKERTFELLLYDSET